MSLTKFLGIVLGCYAVYYFFVVLLDIIKSKSPAIAAGHKDLHAVRYELTEQPVTKSERVSKDTHWGSSSSSPSLASEGSSLGYSNQRIEAESLPEQYDLKEEKRTLKSTFSLEHEEMSEGIEVNEENFSQLLSFV